MQLFERPHQWLQDQVQHKGEYDWENDLAGEVACRKQHEDKLPGWKNGPNCRWHQRIEQHFCLYIALQGIRRYHGTDPIRNGVLNSAQDSCSTSSRHGSVEAPVSRRSTCPFA